MLFKRISRSAPEQIFVVAQNVSGSTVTAGYSVVWDTSASVDGVRVTRATTATLQCFAGVADADIANSAYGLLQVYGYRSSAYITRSTAKVSAAGVGLELVNSDWGLMPNESSPSATKSFAFICETVTSTSGTADSWTTAKVFIRGL
jgi:hypothetical protein